MSKDHHGWQMVLLNRLRLLYGSWWKWQKACGRGTFASRHLFLIGENSSQSLTPLQGEWGTWPVAGQPPLGYDCALWTRRKDGNGQTSWCQGRNWKYMCNIYCVYHQILKKQGRNFLNRAEPIAVVFSSFSFQCYYFHGAFSSPHWVLPTLLIGNGECADAVDSSLRSTSLGWCTHPPAAINACFWRLPAAPSLENCPLEALKTPCLRGQLTFC